jgi:hypothetical protein
MLPHIVCLSASRLLRVGSIILRGGFAKAASNSSNRVKDEVELPMRKSAPNSCNSIELNRQQPRLRRDEFQAHAAADRSSGSYVKALVSSTPKRWNPRWFNHCSNRRWQLQRTRLESVLQEAACTASGSSCGPPEAYLGDPRMPDSGAVLQLPSLLFVHSLVCSYRRRQHQSIQSLVSPWPSGGIFHSALVQLGGVSVNFLARFSTCFAKLSAACGGGS